MSSNRHAFHSVCFYGVQRYKKYFAVYEFSPNYFSIIFKVLKWKVYVEVHVWYMIVICFNTIYPRQSPYKQRFSQRLRYMFATNEGYLISPYLYNNTRERSLSYRKNGLIIWNLPIKLLSLPH